MRNLVLASLLCWLVVSCGKTESSAPSATTQAVTVRDSQCMSCHTDEAAAWKNSHHDRAMDLATEATVLGNFDDQELVHATGTARFTRRGEEFWIRTTGPDGTDQDYQVRYVFGVEPLQQYMIEFPGGAVQCCDLAWDSDEGKWFDLTPDEPYGAEEPMHWTGPYQRWNAMCADCHSTVLDKQLNIHTGEYDTTWNEIDVGCQACHGSGAGHISWIENGLPETIEDGGFEHSVKRGEVATQIEACAPCHSRRTPLSPLDPDGTFFDKFEPATLRQGLYHADGQILDEVYVYGSFTQSKMFMKGVACTECHDPHTTKLVLEGNALCMQCHIPEAPLERFPTLQKKDYDTPEHHHHAAGSEGSRCVACHMPERTYMRIDERRDHSFRIPRPDLSVDLGTPNACNDCHSDKDAQWAAKAVEEWYGPREDTKPHFAYPFLSARSGDPRAFPWLADIAVDVEQPPIVRATAIELLEPYGQTAFDALAAATRDENPFVRTLAARSLSTTPLQQRVSVLLPLLEDPVRSVRIQAGRSLAELKAQAILPEREQGLIDNALGEYQSAQEYSYDLPGPHLNLGRMYEESGQRDKAISEYRKALEIDPWFLQASFNLSALMNQLGRNAEAETVLGRALALYPDEGELRYSLGLLRAEMGRMEASAEALTEAARLMPNNPRVQYNLGLVQQELGRDGEAENALLAAFALYPDDLQTAHALALLYQRQGDLAAAERFATQLTRLNPEEPAYGKLLEEIRAAAR